MKTITISLAFLVVAVFSQGSDEWPVAHNKGHTGFSPSTVLKPPFKVRWMTRVANLISGESGNGAVVAEGKVLIQDFPQDLICLDADNGQLLWRYTLPYAAYGFHFFPCIASGKVYAVFSVKGNPAANGIRCLDLNTGDSLWKRDAGLIASFRMKDSPQYSNGRIFLHSLRDVNQSTLAQNNYRFQAQVQAWDAVTGDTLWTYLMGDSVQTRDWNNYNLAYGTALCVAGDTLFASYCDAATGLGRTVALDLDGNLVWPAPVTQVHVDSYSGNIEYTGGLLLVHTVMGGTGAVTALNPRDGSVIYRAGGTSYSKISAVMNNRFWNRGYGGTPMGFNLSTGASEIASVAHPNGSLTRGWQGGAQGAFSGCSAPRAANGYVYAGIGIPGEEHNNPWLGAWNEAGQPVWWFHTDAHVCQDVAIAYDRLYWLTSMSGEVYCFESEDRTVASVKALCLPETLEQYTGWETPGYPSLTSKPSMARVTAVVAFTDGSRDTTSMGCAFTSLDTFTAHVSGSGNVIANNLGIALIRVERYGVADTARIPIVPSTAPLDSLRLTVTERSLGLGEVLAVNAVAFFHNALGPVRAVVDTFAAWTSGDTAVALVEQGLVSARAAGGPIRIVAAYKGRADTLMLKVIVMPAFIRRINFQVDTVPFRSGWNADNGAVYSAARGYGWLNAADIGARRDDRCCAVFLLESFVQSAAPTGYRIDVPDGDYALRIGMGDISWGSGSYDWTVFGTDTLCRKPLNASPGYRIETHTVSVSGGSGLALTVKGFLDYIVIASADQGAGILCDLADDDYLDPACATPAEAGGLPMEGASLSFAPNPFNPAGRITVSLPASQPTDLSVYDLKGRLVQRIFSGTLGKGIHAFSWNGARAASGIYIYRMVCGANTLQARAILLK